MDPKFNIDWSANEIEMVRSLIASHDANKRCANKNTNDKHNSIVDELHAMFPRKDRRQVTDLYVDLVVEMINNAAQKSSNQQLPIMMVSNDDLDLVVNNSGVRVENLGVHTMDVLHSYLPDEMKATKRKMVEEQHHRSVVPQQNRPRAGRFWTLEEHRNFLCGLRMYGRGNWKSIARDFVPTKTAVQVSSHAQKFFRRQESTTKKLRYSINDVDIYNAEPWTQNNTSNGEAFTFTNNAYNPYCYGFGGQHASMGNLTQVYSPFASQASSSSQTVTLTRGQQAPIFSPAAPMIEGDGTQMK